MTVINPSSISGITSITMPSGDGNVLTIHTNDGVERFRIDSSGNVKVGSACTISQDGDVFFTGVTTATTFTGAHSGNGANLTNLPAGNLTGTLPAISAANLTNVPAANVTGTLPALTAANLTNIPAANLVGVCTSGLTKTGGFGKLLKYETYTTTTATATTGQTFVDTGLSGTIQPSVASSKILVIISQYFRTNSSTVNTGTAVQVLEGSNVVVASENWDKYYYGGGGAQATSMNFYDRYAVTMIHTPSYSVGDTLTYKTQMKSLSDGGLTNSTAQYSSSPSYITLIEVAG